MVQEYKFEKLEVWQLATELFDHRDNPKCVNFEEIGAKLFAKLQAFIKALDR